MKTLKFSLIIYFSFLFTGISPVFSQKFEGILTYNIMYLPKNKNINIKNLGERNGTQMKVFVKKGLYKSVRYNNTDTFETSLCFAEKGLKYFRSGRQMFYSMRHIAPDSLQNLTKLDTAASFKGTDCDVYSYNSGKTSTLFFTKKTRDTENPDYRYHTLFLFTGPLLKVKIKNPLYLTIIELDTAEVQKIADQEFELQNYYSISSADEITNTVLSKPMTEQFLNCLQSKMKYPSLAKRHQIIGKINIQFIIDEHGLLMETHLVPVFFRKYLTLKNIADKQVLEKYLRLFEKEYTAASSACLSNLTFEIPQTKYGVSPTIISIPMTLTFDTEFSGNTNYNDENDANSEHFEFSYDDDDFN